MMLPQPVYPTSDPCELASRWGISTQLSSRLVYMASRVPFGFSIISGWRSCDEQRALEEAGRPAASCETSTHVATCPATGADLRPSIAVTNVVKAQLGAAAVFAGLRWGGGSPIDPQTGIPSDWNHVDLGPVSARGEPRNESGPLVDSYYHGSLN